MGRTPVQKRADEVDRLLFMAADQLSELAKLVKSEKLREDVRKVNAVRPNVQELMHSKDRDAIEGSN